MSVSADSYAVGINLYDSSLENEIKNYRKNNELNTLEALESAIEDYDEKLEDLFTINNIKEVENQKIFDKWSSKWM